MTPLMRTPASHSPASGSQVSGSQVSNDADDRSGSPAYARPSDTEPTYTRPTYTRRRMLGRALALTGLVAADGVLHAVPALAASSTSKTRAASKTPVTSTTLSKTSKTPSASAAPPSSAAARAAAAVPGVTADDGASIVSVTALDARTVDLTVSSPALGLTAPVRLILPADWSSSATRTWPVLYLLQGAHDDYTSWTRETDIESFTADVEVIVAMPSSGPTGIPTTWWTNGTDKPDYETFQLVELAQLLERNYLASTVRAIGGVSTGGYGAVAMAARHPGAFTAAASYSGILDTTFPGMPIVIDAIVLRESLNPLSLWGDIQKQSSIWHAFNPFDQASGLHGTSLYISQGSGVVNGHPTDIGPEILESGLWPAAVTMVGLLDLLGIPATTDFYEGGSHSWAYWEPQFHASWPLLASSLGLG